MATNNAPETATDAPKRVIVSGAIPPELAEKFEDFRWQKRLSKGEVVILAIEKLLG